MQLTGVFGWRQLQWPRHLLGRGPLSSVCQPVPRDPWALLVKFPAQTALKYLWTVTTASATIASRVTRATSCVPVVALATLSLTAAALPAPATSLPASGATVVRFKAARVLDRTAQTMERVTWPLSNVFAVLAGLDWVVRFLCAVALLSALDEVSVMVPSTRPFAQTAVTTGWAQRAPFLA